MARNGSGTYNLPAGNPVVTGTTISSTTTNNTFNDIATALTGSLSKDGQTTPTGNLPMGGYAHTGVADATVRTQYGTAGQMQDSATTLLTSISGTNTIVATAALGMIAYATGQVFTFIPAVTNTGATTININAIGAKSITKNGATALVSGDIVAGTPYQIFYDGTQFQLLEATNSSLVTFLQSGSGAVTTTVQVKLRETVSVGDFGASTANTGAANVTAFNAAKTASPSLTIPNGTFSINAVVPFGREQIVGSATTSLSGPGVSFSGTVGNDIYRFSVNDINLQGSTTASGSSLTSNYAHKGVYSNVAVQNSLYGGTLNNAFLNTFVGLYSASNTNGFRLEANSNACAFFGSSFNNNTTTGLEVVGSYANTFIGCDFEYNYDGIWLVNTITGSAAEHRSTNIAFSYLEANANHQILVGNDGSSSDVVKDAKIIGNYFSVTSATSAITVQKASDTKILWNNFAGTYTVNKIFLRSTSSNTTIVPFISSQVTIEAGATASLETIQKGLTSVLLDGSGNGYIDVTFTVPYSTSVTTLPPIFIQYYDTTDPVTAVIGTFRVNSVTTSGFRIRVIGGTASATYKFFWRAGA